MGSEDVLGGGSGKWGFIDGFFSRLLKSVPEQGGLAVGWIQQHRFDHKDFTPSPSLGVPSEGGALHTRGTQGPSKSQ